MSSQPVHFVLNGRSVSLEPVDPNQTLLQYLRQKMLLTGTKEGCAEGDCGACIAAIGQQTADGGMHWRAINTCIRLLSSIDTMALITIDGLRLDDGSLHPVQQAMVDAHGSQCGFCTPGFVMSLFARYQNGNIADLTRAGIDDLLSGNLCRCTGYRPIIDACLALRSTANDVVEQNQAIALQLQQLQRGLIPTPKASEPDTASGPASNDRSMRPPTLSGLLESRAAYPDAQLIAGCTDVGLWVTKQHRRFTSTLDVTFAAELQQIESRVDGSLRIGAGVRLEPAWQALVERWPQLSVYAARFASLPIRNSGTLGGNIANGSPIGDSMPVLIALNTTVTVASIRGDRQFALESFYLGRQKTQLAPDEVLAWIDIAPPQPNAFVVAYKVSKRFDQDISAVCLCLNVSFDDTPDNAGVKLIKDVRIGVGGVAATPMRAAQTEQGLLAAPWTAATIEAAVQTIQSEFSPISDMRASAAYRRQVIGSLLQRAWRESQGQLVALEAMS